MGPGGKAGFEDVQVLSDFCRRFLVLPQHSRGCEVRQRLDTQHRDARRAPRNTTRPPPTRV